MLFLYTDKIDQARTWELGKLVKHNPRARKYNYDVTWDFGTQAQKLDLNDYYAMPSARSDEEDPHLPETVWAFIKKDLPEE